MLIRYLSSGRSFFWVRSRYFNVIDRTKETSRRKNQSCRTRKSHPSAPSWLPWDSCGVREGFRRFHQYWDARGKCVFPTSVSILPTENIFSMLDPNTITRISDLSTLPSNQKMRLPSSVPRPFLNLAILNISVYLSIYTLRLFIHSIITGPKISCVVTCGQMGAYQAQRHWLPQLKHRHGAGSFYKASRTIQPVSTPIKLMFYCLSDLLLQTTPALFVNGADV